jgi:hypothetical protein
VAAPRYLPAAAVAGAGVAGAAMAMRSNVRVVPQASINAKATPIGRQVPSSASVNGQPGNGQPGAPKISDRQNNQPPMRSANTGNNVPQNGNAPMRNNVNPALNNRLPLNAGAVPSNPQNKPQSTLSDRPPNARAPGINRSNNTDISHSPNAVQNRPPNARTSTLQRTDTSHAESVPSHVQNTGSPADNSTRGRGIQDRNESTQHINRGGNNMPEPAAHDRGVTTRSNEPMQNTTVAPRTQPTARGPVNNNQNAVNTQNTIRDQPEQRQRQAQQPQQPQQPQPQSLAPAPAAVAAVPAVVFDPQVQQHTLRTAAVLGWDGDWPALAIVLPLRGVAHQLARHSQLSHCDEISGVVFHLRIPYDNLCAAGSVDKLAAALTERFGKNVRVEVEIGTVQQTADILEQAEHAAQLQDARERVQADPFLQALAREFGAAVVPESIRLA